MNHNPLDDSPVLFGHERARLQETAWASRMFTWAFAEMRRVQRKTSDVRVIEHEITVQLTNWEATNGPH